jgi:peptidoglycan/LPS O-acetylase OafA/YrhL
MGLKCFIANVLFLNGIINPSYGSNVALWSLPYEFWFYVMFPLIFLLFQRSYCFFKKLLIVLLLVIVVRIIGFEIVKYFLIWCLGGIPIFIVKKLQTISKLKRIIFNICSCFFFLAVLLYSRLHNPSYIIDLLLSSAACLLISVLVSNNNYFTFDNYTRIVNLFSNISFSLYAVHLPFIFLVISHIDKNFLNLKFNALSFLFYLIVLIFTILFSYFFYYYFERNTNNIKLFVYKRLNLNKITIN